MGRKNGLNKKQQSINSPDKEVVVFERIYSTGVAAISIRPCNLFADQANKTDVRFEFLAPRLERLYFSLRIIMDFETDLLTSALSLFEAAIKNVE